MIQISAVAPNYQTGFAGRTSAVSKTVSNVRPKINPEIKKKVTLGAIIAGIFSAKTAKTNNSEQVQSPKTNWKNTFREEKIYDKQGRLTEILKYSNADDVLSIRETINPDTGSISQKTWYRKDGREKQYKELYDQNGDRQNFISYDKLGNVSWIETYGKKSVKPIEVTWFNSKGNMSEQVKCDEETGDIENRIKFDDDANLIEISEVAGLTGKTTKTTKYNYDGSKTVREFDIVSGEKTGTFEYDAQNNLVNFNVSNERPIRKKFSAIVNQYNTQEPNEFETSKNSKKTQLSKSDIKAIENFMKTRYEMEISE